MSAVSNNNPTGINQYKNCPGKDNEETNRIIIEYDRAGIQNRKTISELLLVEHNIEMSEATVARRRKLLGLKGSGMTTHELSNSRKRQLVMDQLSKDPASRIGPSTVKANIVHDAGVHLTREYIRQEMHRQDPEGFAIREPSAKKVTRTPVVALGPHHEWSGDGHDKLAEIGFPIWGMRDKWGRKWLGLWVVPNNRLKNAIAYLYLSLIKKYKGMPMQSTTDCGSETTVMFGLANALREAFTDLPNDPQLPAHRFLKSIHNITIERGWLQVKLQFGENVKIFWAAGEGIYVESDPVHYNLAQWLWSTLIQAELDDLVTKFNNRTIRKDKKSALPTGVSPNVAISLCHKYGGVNCLQSVDLAVVQHLMDAIGDDVLHFVSPEYAAHARRVFDTLNVSKLSFDNVWAVFERMLPIMAVAI